MNPHILDNSIALPLLLNLVVYIGVYNTHDFKHATKTSYFLSDIPIHHSHKLLHEKAHTLTTEDIYRAVKAILLDRLVKSIV